MASMSVSGVVSGMDWDSMIDSIIESASAPAQPKVSKKTDLLNKKSLFEEMKVTMNSLQSSLSPLKLPSTYKAKQVDIERIDSSSSYKGVLTATVNADAEVNVYDIKVNQIATAQINRSKQITSSTLASTLGGLTSSTLYVNAGGQQVGIEVKATDSLESLKSRINTTLKTLDNPIHVTALVLDNKLILKSDNTGLGTYTNEEKINYNISGVNTLSNFTVDENNLDNLSITSGSKKYTIHKDYTIVNGNEIRWKQYDRSAEVALNDTVNVKYTMAANDVYEVSGTYGTNEASLSNLSWVDKGTLASRLKITDGTDTYTYGQDFTINKTTGKVVWLEEAGEATNEPSSYNVTYSKTSTKTAYTSGTKEGRAAAPTSYTVSYTKQLLSPVTVEVNANTYQPASSLNYHNVSALDGLSTTSVSSITDVSYIQPDDASEIKLTDGTIEYVYGSDYILRSPKSTSTSTYPILSWNGDTATGGTKYIDDYAGTSVTKTYSKPASGTSLSLSYTHTYKSTDGISSDVLSAAGTDYENIVITGSDGTTYSYGDDFTITGGAIVWYDSGLSVDDTISDTDFTALEETYRDVYGLDDDDSLPTVTLVDADGVVRTYLDPEDRSLFTMSAVDNDTGKTITYEYGRDYVIRVNDDGDGYVFSWAVTGDNNKDLTVDIKDANTVVTTYTAAKGISTSGWKAAPSHDSAYNFSFTGTTTTSSTATVKSTATDKTLATVLSDVTVDSSDYDTAITITSGSKTYTYGKDYVIDKSGTITWLNQNSDTPTAYTANYTFSSNASTTVSGLSASATLENVSGLPTLSGMGVKTFTSGSHYYVDEAEGKAAFTLTDSAGNVYEYGKDFALRSTSTTGGTLQLVFCHYSNWPSEFSNQDKTRTIPSSETLTLTYNNSVSHTVISSETVKDALGFIPSDYSKLSITDIDGNAYTAGTDYTLNTTTGEITWITSSTAPKHPTGDYTLRYEAADAINSTVEYDGNTTQKVSITTVDGYGNFGGTAMSYEQLLADTRLSSSTESDKFSRYFTLTDGSTTYTYGTDYTIIQGNDTDSDKGEHNVLINWLTDGTKPTSGAALTLTYAGGGESLATDGVTRSATDTINDTPAYSDLSGGTTTITQGSKTFYEGVDFNITKNSSTSEAQIEWISDSDGGTEWYYPNPGSLYTINHTDDDGNTTTYTAYRTASNSLDMSDYGMTTAGGSLVVQYGSGLSYRLDAEASSSTDSSGHDVIKGTYGIDITPTTGGTFNFKWVTPTLTSRTDLPSLNEELTVTYDYDANVYTLTDDGDGLVDLLGLNDDVTAAQNAELVIDGQTITPASNDIGADYNNEIKGMEGITLHLKGVGEVSLDISHDAEKAVESIQTFVDTYNDLMTWMNTRMTESQVDEDTAATIDSDDFRMRWGLLHGNSLLRQTKSQMRNITSQNFTFSFTQRKSSEEVYGTMGFNGLKTSSTLRLRIGTKYVDVTIDPTDTLETIVKKISDDTKGGAMNDIYYDDNGNKLPTALLKASVENDKLVITSSSNEEITMSGTAAMNALKMNYTYKGLYQIGIESTSEDYGKSGELVFNSGEFMEALENNPDEVQTLMLKFVEQFSTWTRGMLNSSASGETAGTLTREINNIQSQVDDINEYLEKYQERLDRMEESLRTRYANTETSLARLNQQASSIAAILNQLNGMGGNNNSSSGS